MKKAFLSSIIAMSLCSFSFADNFKIGDFVGAPGETVSVDVYLTVTSAIEGVGTSIDITAPTGCEFPSKSYKGDLINDGGSFSSDLIEATALRGINVTSAGDLRISTIDTWLDPGTYKYATFTVKIGDTATAGKFVTSNCKVGYTDVKEPAITFNPLNSLTIGKGGYSSYSVCAPVKVTGATVKFATLSGTTLTLSGDGNIVPANKGVILKGTEGATVTLEAVDSDFSQASALSPSVLPTPVEASSTMVLSTGSQGTGFYLFTGTTITANKAYLPSVPSSAPLRIVEDETTGIEEVESEANVGFNYNLMGQQIKSQKGFAIENGKKVVRF